MSKTIANLDIKIRDGSGTGDARALRRQGMVPAIIYGGNKPELKIAVAQKELTSAYQKGRFKSRIIELNDGKNKHKVLPRAVQLHPVSDVPVHADFLRVVDGEKIKVKVKVACHNADKAPGIKKGGVLNIVRHEVEFWCDPNNIPEKIDIDLTGLTIGKSVHINSLKLPEGSTPIIKRNFTLVTIAGRKEKDDLVEDTAPVQGEVEVMAKGKAAAEAAEAAATGAAPAAGAKGKEAAPAKAATPAKEGKK